jgi:hypothetical protein
VIGCDNVSVSSAVRLGKRTLGPVIVSRALKIDVVSEEQKDRILKRAKNLKGKKENGWDKIYIHQDLTPKQRGKRQELVLEMKRRMEAGEGDLIIVNDRIVKRWTRTGQASASLA